MASLPRKSCRLLGCCHILKRENKVLDKQSLNVSPVRFFHETWGEVKVQQNQKHSQENFLLELIKYNKKLVNSKDTFYMINYLLENKLYEDGKSFMSLFFILSACLNPLTLTSYNLRESKRNLELSLSLSLSLSWNIVFKFLLIGMFHTFIAFREHGCLQQTCWISNDT